MILRTLIKAGLKANRAAFAGIAIILALASAMLTFAICLNDSLGSRSKEALAEANAGDVMISGGIAPIDERTIKDIEDLDKVDSVKVTSGIGSTTSYEVDGTLKEGSGNAFSVTYVPWGEAIEYGILDDDTAGPSVIAHEAAPSPKHGQVYVPMSTQTTLGISIGDEVVAKVGDEEFRFIVAEFIEDPQFGSAFVESNCYVISDDDFEAMQSQIEGMVVDALDARQSQGSDLAFMTSIANVYMSQQARDAGMTPDGLARYISENVKLDGFALGFFSSEALSGYTMMVVMVADAVLLVFALIMYVIALVICMHTVSSGVKLGYADFAILKAVGTPSYTIRTSFLIQYLSASAAGTLLGAAVGYLLVPPMLPAFSTLTGLVASCHAPGPVTFAALAALLAVIFLVVLIATRRVSAITPLSALREGTGDVHFNSRLSAGVAGRPLALRLSWRAVTSDARNYMSLLICTALLGFFVMLAYGISDSLQTIEGAYAAMGIWKSDVSVALEDEGLSIEDVEASVSEVARVARVWQEGNMTQNIDGQSRVLAALSDMTVLNGITEGHAPELDNEVAIGGELATSLGLERGDVLKLRDADGNDCDFIVTGIMSTMFNAGTGIVTTYDGMKSLRPVADVFDGFYQLQLEDPSAADAARAHLKAVYGDRVDTADTGLFSSTSSTMELMLGLFKLMGYFTNALAVILAFIAVWLIIGRMFVTERRRLGILRAVGFKARDLRLQFALRFLIVSAIGCSAAGVLVAFFGSWLASQLFGMFGVSQFAISASPLALCVLGAALAVVFFVAAYLCAAKVRHIPASVLIAE